MRPIASWTNDVRAQGAVILFLFGGSLAWAQEGPRVQVGDGQPIQESTTTIEASWKGFERPGDAPLQYRWRIERREGGKWHVVKPNRAVGLRTKASTTILTLEKDVDYRVAVEARYASNPKEWSEPVYAQTIRIIPPEPVVSIVETPTEEVDRFETDPRGLSEKRKDEKPGAGIIRAMENPNTLNSVLLSLLGREGPLNLFNDVQLLKDVQLEFKALQANDGESVLGLGYALDKVITELPFFAGRASGIDLRLKGHGTVAFDSDTNPEDFLTSSVALDYFASFGGVRQADTVTQKLMNELENRLALYTDIDALESSEDWRAFNRLIQNYLTTQYYFDLRVQGSLESDQSFVEKQWVLEFKLGLDIKAWKEESFLAMVNVFDWPTALVRLLTGYDKKLWVRGGTIPTVLIGLGRVSPEAGDPRDDVGDDSDFWRFTLEAGFRTPFARVGTSTVYFNASFRYFRELSPSEEVKDAELDRFHYYTLDISSDAGIFVSYSAGRLPFDSQNDQVYEAGLRVNF